MFIIGLGRPFVASFSNTRQLPDDESHAQERGVFRLRCRVRVRTDEQMHRETLGAQVFESGISARFHEQFANVKMPHRCSPTQRGPKLSAKKKESILENENKKKNGRLPHDVRFSFRFEQEFAHFNIACFCRLFKHSVAADNNEQGV
jgi:hypothetical protein